MSDNEVKGIREGTGLGYDNLIPPESKAAAQAAFEYGAKKYASRNWEKGLYWQAMIESLKRHVDDFERGKDYDDGEGGSGLPQIANIMASACMLSASVIRGIGVDDRAKETEETTALYAKDCSHWIKNALDEAEAFQQRQKKLNEGK